MSANLLNYDAIPSSLVSDPKSAKIIARIALGRGKPKRDREYICSELVYECFANAGKEFAYNTKGFISPEDVWRDEKELMGSE